MVSVASWYIVLVGCMWCQGPVGTLSWLAVCGVSGQLVHCLGRLCVVSVASWNIVLVGCVWCQWPVGTLSW